MHFESLQTEHFSIIKTNQMQKIHRGGIWQVVIGKVPKNNFANICGESGVEAQFLFDKYISKINAKKFGISLIISYIYNRYFFWR